MSGHGARRIIGSMIDQPVALFVFVPFCKIKCTYCDFNAYANMARLMEPFITPAVQKKLDNDLEQLKKLAETAPAQSALR